MSRASLAFTPINILVRITCTDDGCDLMDEDTEIAAWAFQLELEARQREEEQLLKADPDYELWLETFAAQAAHETEN